MRIALLCCLLVTLPCVSQEYNRADWRHWSDFDGDCQNTRHELLIAQSLMPVTFTSDSECYVATGLWIGPYTNEVFLQASDVDIEHVIPLSYAHHAGGAAWSPLLKRVFANDPENLLIVKDNANQSKGDRGPSGYMPRHQYQCEYARKWRHLSRKYDLVLPQADASVLAFMRAICYMPETRHANR